MSPLTPPRLRVKTFSSTNQFAPNPRKENLPCRPLNPRKTHPAIHVGSARRTRQTIAVRRADPTFNPNALKTSKRLPRYPQGHYDVWPHHFGCSALIAEPTHAGARNTRCSVPLKSRQPLPSSSIGNTALSSRLPRRKSPILSQPVTAPIALTPLASRAVLWSFLPDISMPSQA